MKKNRPYTGTADVKVNKQKSRPGVTALYDRICYFFQMRPLGTLTSNAVSVHYTGRAFDVGPIIPAGGDFRYLNINLLRFLSIYSDSLGIEEIHDYCGVYVPGTKTSAIPRYMRPATDPPEIYTERNMFGAGYRCSRQATSLFVEESERFSGWIIWDRTAHLRHGGKTIGSTHIHVEVNPTMADNASLMIENFNKAFKVFQFMNGGWPSFK
jgi:hypothetical protein